MTVDKYYDRDKMGTESSLLNAVSESWGDAGRIVEYRPCSLCFCD